MQTLPKLLHELRASKDRIDMKQKELNVYDKAIAEIESNYGHIIFSEQFFVEKS